MAGTLFIGVGTGEGVGVGHMLFFVDIIYALETRKDRRIFLDGLTPLPLLFKLLPTLLRSEYRYLYTLCIL